MVSTFKFVDQPIASPTVLLDMHNGTTWRTIGEDLDFSPPPLKRSIASNAMMDGGLLTASAYDLRELKFTVRLLGATEADRIAQLKALGNELAKPSNLLMYRPNLAASPVFFRTFRSDSWTEDRQSGAESWWQVKALVLAEPFAIGIRVDLPQVTVSNDPASGTNPTRWDMTGIIGDAPSPAVVRIQAFGSQESVILAQRTINNPADLTVFVQAESATMGTETATFAAGATFSGTGNTGTLTTFTNTNLNTRLTATCPVSVSASAIRGTYRVLVRARSSTGDLPVLLQVGQGDSFSTVVGPKLTFDLNTSLQFCDLGTIQIPAATPRINSIGYSGLAPQYPTSETLRIRAARLSSTANLQMDYIYLLPADERLCMVRQTDSAPGYVVLDGPNDVTYTMEPGTTLFGATRTINQYHELTPRIGGLPELVPGVTNRWYMLTTRPITESKTVDVSYWPRWREVATP